MGFMTGTGSASEWAACDTHPLQAATIGGASRPGLYLRRGTTVAIAVRCRAGSTSAGGRRRWFDWVRSSAYHHPTLSLWRRQSTGT